MSDDEDRCGDCYEAAGKAILFPWESPVKLPGDAVLVHGRPTLTRPPYVEFGHAWLETDTTVYDFAGGRSIVVPKIAYYSIGQIDPDENYTYDSEHARRMLLEYRHWGPWEGPEGCGPVDEEE